MTASAFAKYAKKNYPYRFRCSILVDQLAGGTPMSEKAIEGWLRTKFMDRDDQIRTMVGEVMAEVQADDADATPTDAIEAAAAKMGLCGFKRDDSGLYIEGRQVKSMLKEAAQIAIQGGRLSARGWGTTNKALKGYLAEHIFVIEDRISLGVVEPTGIAQRFIHKMTPKGPVSAFQCEQYITDAKLTFTIETDHDFKEDEWAAIWLTAERNGLGASRSQGFGTFTVTEWDSIKA